MPTFDTAEQGDVIEIMSCQGQRWTELHVRDSDQEGADCETDGCCRCDRRGLCVSDDLAGAVIT